MGMSFPFSVTAKGEISESTETGDFAGCVSGKVLEKNRVRDLGLSFLS
jgi:hypothetical protein